METYLRKGKIHVIYLIFVIENFYIMYINTCRGDLDKRVHACFFFPFVIES